LKDVQKIYKTVLLPVVSSGCETSSLTSRVEERQSVGQNIWNEQDEIIGGWTMLSNEELLAKYY
jgi:hypothetical protein